MNAFCFKVASLNPFIMVLHSLLSDEDIDHLVTWATPRLSRYHLSVSLDLLHSY
jgi:hypothetical protein